MTTVLATPRRERAFNKPAYHYIRESDKLPGTDDAHAQEDPLIRVKLFNPTGIGYWYLAGYDPDTQLAWGIAHLFESEIGDFDMGEIIDLRGQFGLPVERDIHWTPRPLNEVFANLDQGGRFRG